MTLSQSEQLLVIDTAFDLLMSDRDLFVVKNDFTPNKINAKQSDNFQKNCSLLEQPVDLCWTSRKGFSVGVVFYGPDRDMPIRDSFPTSSGTNTFIARFNLSGIHAQIAKAGQTLSVESIQKALTEQNTFSSWLFWPQYPHVQNIPIMHDDYGSAYELWMQLSDSSGGYVGFPDREAVGGVRAVYKGSNRTKNTGEVIYRFLVIFGGKSDNYHLIEYDGELYLLDYMYDTVPLTHENYTEIHASCSKAMPRKTCR
ncbi:hypothetical protein I8254_19185 [Providencia rettgeri]|uniref:hypothetical protein n=1 Tax=Providencia rettgeri TaxID=587 RepID=UPI00190670FD|nr:hypothetical protein [Providencia rettgeri]MBJ9973122.1 hypothetical protein [Providencia rettgeri]